MDKFNRIVTAAVFAGGLMVAAAPQAGAISVFDQCAGDTSAAVCKSSSDTAPPLIKTVINLLLFLLGAVSVFMIVLAGHRYTRSQGDAAMVKSAKDTILYAIIGLVVAVLSYSIINFTLAALK